MTSPTVTLRRARYQESGLEAIPAVDGALASQIPRSNEESEDGERGPAEELHGKGRDEAGAAETGSRLGIQENQTTDQGDARSDGEQFERVPDGLFEAGSRKQERGVEDGVQGKNAQQ